MKTGGRRFPSGVLSACSLLPCALVVGRNAQCRPSHVHSFWWLFSASSPRDFPRQISLCRPSHVYIVRCLSSLRDFLDRKAASPWQQSKVINPFSHSFLLHSFQPHQRQVFSTLGSCHIFCLHPDCLLKIRNCLEHIDSLSIDSPSPLSTYLSSLIPANSTLSPLPATFQWQVSADTEVLT